MKHTKQGFLLIAYQSNRIHTLFIHCAKNCFLPQHTIKFPCNFMLHGHQMPVPNGRFTEVILEIKTNLPLKV